MHRMIKMHRRPRQTDQQTAEENYGNSPTIHSMNASCSNSNNNKNYYNNNT